MSWFCGIYFKKEFNRNIADKLKYLSGSVFRSDNFIAAVAGKTGFLSENKSLSAAVGFPLNENVFPKKNAEGGFPDDDFQISGNGHFAYFTFINNNLVVANDRLGLREVYYSDDGEKFVFSTRQDLIIEITGNNKINFPAFGSLWNGAFQLSADSFISGITRLGPGGRIEFSGNNLIINRKPFTPEKKREDFADTLKYFTNINNKNISLALSGGIDSRLILSFLLNNGVKFQCHTLLNDEGNDIRIAEKICGGLGLTLNFIERPRPDLSALESLITEQYKFIPPVFPITQIIDFSASGMDYLKDKIVIDGGFGGFYRRQYFNKLFIRGYKYFTPSNVPQILQLLSGLKADIFNGGLNSILNSGAAEDVKNLLNEFPRPSGKNELAEILDLISIRYMLPGVYSPGQILLDRNYRSFMPLARPEVISAGFNIPANEKSDSVFIKKLISNRNKKLTEIPLVNNNFVYPFRLNYKIAMAALLLKKKFGGQNKRRYLHKLLLNSEDFVRELISKTNLQKYSFYDTEKTNSIAEEFYSGNYAKSNELEWLISFEFWRRANGIRG